MNFQFFGIEHSVKQIKKKLLDGAGQHQKNWGDEAADEGKHSDGDVAEVGRRLVPRRLPHAQNDDGVDEGSSKDEELVTSKSFPPVRGPLPKVGDVHQAEGQAEDA